MHQLETEPTAAQIAPDETKHTIIIVGAGYGGYRFFAESLKKTLDEEIADAVRYVIVDPRPIEEYGCGLAWSPNQIEALRANMHSTTIQLDDDGDDTLYDILKQPPSELATVGRLFEARRTIGSKLHESFLKCLCLAVNNGVEVHLVRSKIEKARSVGRAYCLSVSDGSSITGHSVVLALGHFPSTNYQHLEGEPGYYLNPWKWESLREIEPGARVALIGLGPTAVDAMLVLREGGHERIDAFSRSGLMQYPRPRPKVIEETVMTENYLREAADALRGLRLDTVSALLFSKYSYHDVDWRPLREAILNSFLPPEKSIRRGLLKANEEESWFGLLVEFEQFLPLIWHLLLDRDKEKFVQAQRKLANVTYGMAPPQALRVLDEMDHGRFSPRGGLSSIVYDPPSKSFAIETRLANSTIKSNYDCVIDCSGLGSDLTACKWPLVKSLKDGSFLFHHPRGGAIADFETGQLLDEERRPTSEIYCLVGSLMLGEHLVTNGIGKVKRSATRTADAIHKKLHSIMRTKNP